MEQVADRIGKPQVLKVGVANNCSKQSRQNNRRLVADSALQYCSTERTSNNIVCLPGSQKLLISQDSFPFPDSEGTIWIILTSHLDGDS